MNRLGFSKVGAAITAVVVVGLIGTGISVLLNKNGGKIDDGIDVSKTACEDIGTARQAVNGELQARKDKEATDLENAMEAASDAFWTENRRLEDEHHACISQALIADPCKDEFEEISRLYEEIMQQFNDGGGFNEEKFNEREEAKKKYEECVENPEVQEDSYENQKAACDAALAAGQETNQNNRQQAETTAQTAHDQAVAQAESNAKAKHAQLDAIEEKCNEPGGNTNVSVGGLSTGSTGTPIASSSAACTGTFAGNDPELEAELRLLESQLQKARAAGLTEGLYGTAHLSQAVADARARLNASERSCEVDADCGDPTPVCCSGTSVGRVYCDAGICANEITQCDDNEVCAGEPAMCVAASEGAQSVGLDLERTIPEVGTCSQKLRVLNLQQASTESVRYEITGNIPSWVNIDKPGGTLPQDVDVSYSCNTVQGFGPGTYTASGSITIYNSANELINTIPLNISITVTPVESEEDDSQVSTGQDAQVMVEVIQYGNNYIPVDQLHKFSGPECDEAEHWHANAGSVTALSGTVIADSDECGFGKTSQVPVMSVPDTRMEIKVEGMEELRTN